MSSGKGRARAVEAMDDAALVDAVVRATGRMPQTAAARALGVSQVSVSRWRAGERRELWRTTRAKLEAYLRGTQAEAEADAPAPVLDWLRDFERVVELMDERNRDLEVEERRARKLDLVTGMIEVRRRRGADAPAILYAMLRRVERGEL